MDPQVASTDRHTRRERERERERERARERESERAREREKPALGATDPALSVFT